MPKLISKATARPSKASVERVGKIFGFNEKPKVAIAQIGKFSKEAKNRIRTSLESARGRALLHNVNLRNGRQPNSTFSEKEMNAVVDEVYKTLFDERYNGIASKDFSVPDGLIRGYYANLERSDPIDIYHASLVEAKSPFELFMSRQPLAQEIYQNWALSRPTWQNWTRGGELSRSRVEQYNAIYDSMSSEDKKLLNSFMAYTDLPMESAIQMMTPEYYNYLKKTNTPFMTGNFIEDGVPQHFYSPIYNPSHSRLDTKHLRNYGSSGNEFIPTGLHDSNASVSLTDIPSEITHFRPSDLYSLVNNVQYVGNRFPFAERLYLGGDNGFQRGMGIRNRGAAYGSFSPKVSQGIAYAGAIGRTHHVSVGGRPFIPVQNDVYVLPNGMEFHPDYVDGNILRQLHEYGYDWFGDFRNVNQFATGNSYRIKNLIGNNGNFDTSDINWFHRSGGKVSMYKRYNPLRHK